MQHILAKIVAAKKEEVAAAQVQRPIERLIELTADLSPPRPFFRQLQKFGPTKINIIAEIKRSSPSAGVIRSPLDAAHWAAAYQTGGAAAISVLTEQLFFQGSPGDLSAAKTATTLPVLRKDFIISSYQIYESAFMGADAVLLIVRLLSPLQLSAYFHLAQSLNLDVLVEIHTEKDLQRAQSAGARLIGLNNRDLASFNTDTNRALKLVNQLSENQVAVAASGIQNHQQVMAAFRAGIGNFLIGESLVRSEDPALHLKRLMGTKIE